MSILANRLRAAGVSEARIFQLGLASRSVELPEKATDEELTLAHDYNNTTDPFERARIRERNPQGLARGRTTLSAIDQWLAKNDVARKHGHDK